MANFAILLCLFLASKINSRLIDPGKNSRRSVNPETSFYLLCIVMLVSFMFDETALISYAVIPLFFPRVVFGGTKKVILYAAIPLATFCCYFKLFPWFSALAGYPNKSLFSTTGYFSFIHSPAGALHAANIASTTGELIAKAKAIITSDLFTNIKIFISDISGLVNPALSKSILYYFLWSITVTLLAIMAVLAVMKSVRILRRGEPFFNNLHFSVGFASAAALVLVTLFANTLLHLVDNHIWGLHWLNTFWAIFFFITAAFIINKAGFNRWLVAAAAIAIMSTSYYNFVYVNNAFKNFYYYHSIDINAVWTHKANRFDVPLENSLALYAMIRFIWKENGRQTVIRSIPTELYYLAHDLRLISPGTSYAKEEYVFDGYVKTFSLEKQNPPGGFFIAVPEK